MNKAKKMNSSLAEIVIPQLCKIGFKGSFPHFRRILAEEIHLITFQFDRQGGGFIIKITKAKNEPFKTYWGKIITQKKLTTHDLNNRVRIHPKGILENSTPENWFRYDKFNLFIDIYAKISKDVLKQIELIENTLMRMPIYDT